MNTLLERFLEEPGGHVLVDKDLRIVDVGPQFARMNLTSRSNLIGKSLFTVMYAEEEVFRQIRHSIDLARETKIPDKIGPLRVLVKPLAGDRGKAQERWWSFASIPLEDEYLVQRVEDHTTEAIALRRINAQRISNYILYLVVVALLGVVAYTALHYSQSIHNVSRQTCLVQARSLPGQHHLSKAMQDINVLLLEPPPRPPTHIVSAIEADLEYHLQRYVNITGQQPTSRVCP